MNFRSVLVVLAEKREGWALPFSYGEVFLTFVSALLVAQHVLLHVDVIHLVL